MSIPVKRIKRKQINGAADAPELYYLVPEPGLSQTITEKQIAYDIEMIGGMSQDDATHVFNTFVRRLRFYLIQGNKVKINGLGTFHLTFNNKGTVEEKDCTVRNINKVNIRFKVDKELRIVNGSTMPTRTENSVSFYVRGESTAAAGDNDGGGGGGNQGGNDPGWIDPDA